MYTKALRARHDKELRGVKIDPRGNVGAIGGNLGQLHEARAKLTKVK